MATQDLASRVLNNGLVLGKWRTRWCGRSHALVFEIPLSVATAQIMGCGARSWPSGSPRAGLGHTGASDSFASRTRLYPARVTSAQSWFRSTPQNRSLRAPATVFIHPKTSSTRLRIR